MLPCTPGTSPLNPASPYTASSPAPNLSRFYRRGSTNTQLPPPHWLRGARLGHSAAQQVGAAGLSLPGRAPQTPIHSLIAHG